MKNKFIIIIIVLLFTSVHGLNLLYAKNTISLNGVALNGFSDVILLPNCEDFNSKAITGEAFVKVSKFESAKSGGNEFRQFILFKKNSLKYYNEGYTLYLDEVGHRFLVTVSSANLNQITIASPLETVRLNEWYHLAFTADSNEVKLYINGILQSSQKTGFKLDYDVEPLYIGGRNKILNKGIYDGRFNGFIDEVKLWNYVKSQDEISSTIFEHCYCNEKGLIAYLPFDNISGNIIEDLGPNNYHGILLKTQDCIESSDLVPTRTQSKQESFDIAIEPNPITDESTIKLNITQKSAITIYIYDLQGREKSKINLGEFEIGKHSFPLSYRNLHLPNGIYFVTFTTENNTKTIQIITLN